MPRFHAVLNGLCILASLLVVNAGFAQQPPPNSARFPANAGSPASSAKGNAKATYIEVELLADGGLTSQEWLKTFEALDVSVRIRKSTGTEKPGVTEREVGTLRYVTVIGTLDRSGKAVLGGKTFALTDAAKLKDWITELKTYGAQGSPTGQPMWGLTKEQFTKLYELLAAPVTEDLQGEPIEKAITRLNIPATTPCRWSLAAQQQLKASASPLKVRQDVGRFTTATALAIALNDVGFGFRPGRTPQGGVELVIEPRDGKETLWPIGWPLLQPRPKAAPKLFAMTVVELDQQILGDVLVAAEELASIPILLDHHELQKAKLNVDTIKVSFPRKQTTWSIALRSLCVPAKLTREVWQDEAGKPFVWITPTRAARPNNPDPDPG